MTASWQPSAPGLCFIYSPHDATIHAGVLYADNGFWVTFRTVYPLLALLFLDKLSEIVNGWVQAANEGGHFPKWASPDYRNCMIGTHLDEDDLPYSLSMVDCERYFLLYSSNRSPGKLTEALRIHSLFGISPQVAGGACNL